MLRAEPRDWRTWRQGTLNDPGPQFWEASERLVKALTDQGISRELFWLEAADLYEIRTLGEILGEELTPERRALLVSQVLDQCQSQPEWTDFLLILGEPRRAREIYLRQPGAPRWSHAAAVASFLLGEDDLALDYFHSALQATTEGEGANIAYSLGQQLFWMARLSPALQAFRNCRERCRAAGSLEHIRLTSTWIKALQWHLNPPPDRPALAFALRPPH